MNNNNICRYGGVRRKRYTLIYIYIYILMKWYQKFLIRVLKMGKIPKSIAIIMDGNRRFATKNHKEKHEGHSFGL